MVEEWPYGRGRGMALWSWKGGTFFSTVFSTYCQVVEFIMQQQTETKSDVMFCFLSSIYHIFSH